MSEVIRSYRLYARDVIPVWGPYLEVKQKTAVNWPILCAAHTNLLVFIVAYTNLFVFTSRWRQDDVNALGLLL